MTQRFAVKALVLAVGLSAAMSSLAAKLTVVEVITSPPRTALLQKMLDDYKTQHPGTEIELISLPWGQAFEKLGTMLQSGQVPDVVEMPDTWQGLYASNNMLEDLEPRLKSWDATPQLTDKTLAMARAANGKATMVPYGFYLRALFWNKKLFQQAGLSEPPKTMEEFASDAQRISKLGNGISGYCMRGGVGGTNAWMMFMAAMNGSPEFFDKQGNSTLTEPGAMKGAQLLVDMYQKGGASKDSVNWGFNEIVSGFYSGKCAMLDQDPDALIAIKNSMAADDFAVAPMPVGPSGKAFPTIGYTGWSMFKQGKQKDLAWPLITFLSDTTNNLAWSKFVGTLPIYKGAEQDPFYHTPQFAGWFKELNDPNYVPLTMPTHLKGWGYFNSVIVKESSQETLLGENDTESMVKDWANYLSKEQKAWLATQ
ncbi:sugar ABC transporter substrate-binding protein [Pantoea sp. PNT03]|jgi:multiple sugar transport system substrate-binding protein|uniref:ABC transporter substrate-binding protein n=1 Tax=Pantoea sp. PNT03 TaxID=2769258 RepID=UPI00177D42EB|nr:sugar ABC transporter substrate-binding protein [Pantoea sp. PNT03]MBD9659670.1 sugar ABC transporter substrate-binding protein [Pantoea sp. PNT03]